VWSIVLALEELAWLNRSGGALGNRVWTGATASHRAKGLLSLTLVIEPFALEAILLTAALVVVVPFATTLAPFSFSTFASAAFATSLAPFLAAFVEILPRCREAISVF
jgi:hypothetical protein